MNRFKKCFNKKRKANEEKRKRKVSLFPCPFRLLPVLVLPVLLCPALAQTWRVSQRGTLLEIFYGSGSNWPQYAALHVDSSYFRMVYSPQSGWGTSIILLPAFWSQGRYYQGAPVNVSWRIEGADLILSVSGTIASLSVSEEVRLHPPAQEVFTAQVAATVTGDVPIDNRPGEAFKPVMLSSMHISDRLWDTQTAYVECQSFAIPSSGWIIPSPITGRLFGLIGGTSDWKVNAPTIEVALEEPLQVTGWVTYSNNPNDDNVGFWAASDRLMRSWRYALRCAPTRTFEISGRLTLDDYGGDYREPLITVELRPAGSRDPIRVERLQLDLAGNYRLAQVPPGTYDLAFKGSHWLRRVVRNVRVSQSCVSSVNATLLNGDVNDNNQVEDSDLAGVLLDFGQPPSGNNGETDLDGDHYVADPDLAIVLRRFGQLGDP